MDALHLVLATGAPASVVSNYRYDHRRTGIAPRHTAVSALGYALTWQTPPYNVREYWASKSSAAVDLHTIYYGTDRSTLVALDRKTGRRRWEFVMDPPHSPKGVHGTAAFDPLFDRKSGADLVFVCPPFCLCSLSPLRFWPPPPSAFNAPYPPPFASAALTQPSSFSSPCVVVSPVWSVQIGDYVCGASLPPSLARHAPYAAALYQVTCGVRRLRCGAVWWCIDRSFVRCGASQRHQTLEDTSRRFAGLFAGGVRRAASDRRGTAQSAGRRRLSAGRRAALGQAPVEVRAHPRPSARHAHYRPHQPLCVTQPPRLPCFTCFCFCLC